MNETKRVHSIARKIGNSWTWRTFWLMFWLDILIAAMVLAGFAYSAERGILGDRWQPKLEREIVWEGPQSFETLSAIEYRFQSPEGEWHAANIQHMLHIAFPGAVTLGIFEIIFLISEASHAHKKARKLLKPLDKIARDMQAFSQIKTDGAHYEDRLHDLEQAIGHISPTQPDMKLRTGAEELSGLENAINDLLVRMHESYRQQAQFVSDASHELRTPIAVIQGYAHMLARWGKDDPKVLEESISAIQSESDYMKKLVEELLFLARGEIGRNPFEPAELSLTDLIREVCDESAMIDADHEWIFRGNSEIMLTADSAMLKQCARILCENARKYAPAGSPITLHARQSADGPQFYVQDEGIGIGTEDVSRVFDRFYRSDPARDRNSGGSGLGLAIARWIVERHGGYLDVLSREGVGTRFTVTLPPKANT